VFNKLLGYDILTALFFSLALFIIFIFPSVLSKDRKNIPTNLNLMTTMLLGGFWHGASWNFIVWGALHGIGLAIHKIWMLLTGKALSSITGKTWYRAVSIFITFHFVCFCWIFFKTDDFAAATQMISQITSNLDFSVWPAFYDNYKPVLAMILIAGLLHAIPDNYADKIISRFPRLPLVAYLSVFFAFVLLYGLFKSAEPVMPIYLQF
jgi:D-alanyl-lipoteichoic acid acyltransferase DltB (MBOAT superfamily)